MWLSLGQGRLQLDGDTPVAFRRARGCWIECTQGRLWITVTGQPGDIFLAPGERVRIVSNGLALVSGFPSGTVSLVHEASWPLLRTTWDLLRQGTAKHRRRAQALTRPLSAWRLRPVLRRS
ncbi:DUF2917 domain-containing protein [Hylemonella gracilis]|jgi:hypothetical protein|uniref:DUF2917 domain-containing protein n=1 Tax=Hylemonella gracilis TaxID=80880 RepID=A0A4P6UKJ0_9BURK|nr:DUF2917 domain-containing protein [Hylemonella gracilis]QBK03891.1 DUF2917 domain-containing protein [Hylemonella gracilis]